MVQYNAALRDQVVVRQLNIVDAARMFAAVDMSLADMVITVWHGKYLYGFWRPITAINLADTDGNEATDVDTTWVPLIAATPNYPEYTSGYAAVTAAFTRALGATFDTRHLQLTLISTAVPNTTRYYDSGAALRRTWSTPESGWASTSASRTPCLETWAFIWRTGSSTTTSSRPTRGRTCSTGQTLVPHPWLVPLAGVVG